MKECSAFTCKYSRDSRGFDICYYSDELCTFIDDNCSMIDTNNPCSVCENAVDCGLKGGDGE